MTACVNKRRALAAALAGVLALGGAAVALPAVALAEGASLQVASPTSAFSSPYSVTFADGTTARKANGTIDYGTTFTYSKNLAHEVIPVKVVVDDTLTEEPIDLSAYSDAFTVEYYKADSKTHKATSEKVEGDVNKVGSYVVRVTCVDEKGIYAGYNGGSFDVYFEVAEKAFGQVLATDNTVTYDASEQEFEFTANGTPIYEGTDYTVKYYKTGHDAEKEINEVKPVDAGTYVAKLTGIGEYEGTVALSEVLTIEPLDLSTAVFENMYIDSKVEPESPDAVIVEGKRITDEALLSQIQIQNTDKKKTVWDNTKYVFVATPVKTNDGNFKNFGTVNVYKVAELATFSYKGQTWPGSVKTVVNDTVNYPKLDSAYVTASNALGTISYSWSAGTIARYDVYDADGNKATGPWWLTPGSYSVVYYTTEAGMSANANALGGKAVMEVVVYQDSINADATVFVSYDSDGLGTGKQPAIVDSISTTYDKSVNLNDGNHIGVAVKDSTGSLISPADYTVSFYDADGNQVTEVTDAGTYTMKITSSKYELTGSAELTITIAKKPLAASATLKTAKFDDASAGAKYVAWRLGGYTVDDLGITFDNDGNVEYADVSDSYKVTIVNAAGETVKRITDEGVYTVKFVARNSDAEKNYEAPADITVTCIKDGSNPDKYGNYPNHLKFADVKYTDYFADAVDYVSTTVHVFMNGYANTNLFGSRDGLTRGQMAIVLYNMAVNQNKVDETSLSYSTTSGYKSFADVDGTMYYAKAIAWAKQAGIVTGYGDTGNYGPDDLVTREQFALMLSRYAAKFGGAEISGGDLSAYADAASVSSWAEDAVAWCVSEGIMGVNTTALSPQASIIRADAACMVYRYAK